MLGVSPKSSGGATNRCVMSRLTKCAVPGPFRAGIESGVPRTVCRSDIGAASAYRPRSGDRSGSMTRAPRAGCPARFPAGLCGDAGVQRFCALRSRALSVSLLQEEFRTAVRRLIVSIGIFAIPVAVYLLEAKQSQNNAEPYAIVWGVYYVVSLLILLPSLATLIRDANRERKTGFYRFRR